MKGLAKWARLGDAAMSSVGSHLRELRERRGASLEEIARSTRVLHRYLAALEADAYAVLPAPVFTKGFIRAYCQALGVAPDEALALYAERGPGGGDDTKTHIAGVRAAQGSPPQVFASGKRREGGGRGDVLASFLMLVVLGLALFAVTFWLQPARELRSESRPGVPVVDQRVAGGPTPEAPKGVGSPTAPAAHPQAPAPRPEAAAAPVPIPLEPPVGLAGVTAPYRLVARTSERTWLRVRTQDGRTSEENIPAGETREWVSNRPFVLAIGNAGGVALELNGRRVPRLGPSGAVIERLVLPSEGP